MKRLVILIFLVMGIISSGQVFGQHDAMKRNENEKAWKVAKDTEKSMSDAEMEAKKAEQESRKAEKMAEKEAKKAQKEANKYAKKAQKDAEKQPQSTSCLDHAYH